MTVVLCRLAIEILYLLFSFYSDISFLFEGLLSKGVSNTSIKYGFLIHTYLAFHGVNPVKRIAYSESQDFCISETYQFSSNLHILRPTPWLRKNGFNVSVVVLVVCYRDNFWKNHQIGLRFGRLLQGPKRKDEFVNQPRLTNGYGFIHQKSVKVFISKKSTILILIIFW